MQAKIFNSDFQNYHPPPKKKKKQNKTKSYQAPIVAVGIFTHGSNTNI